MTAIQQSVVARTTTVGQTESKGEQEGPIQVVKV